MKSRILRLFGSSAPAAPPLDAIERARALHQQGQRDASAALYREILEAHPHSAAAHYRYANLLKDQGDLSAAVEHYDRAVALEPDHAHACCNRAVALGLMGRLPESLASYDRAIAIDPADVIALCNRGVLLIGLGRKDAALASFEQAIAHDGGCFPALFGRAALLQERKAWDESLATYDRAIAANPADAPAHYNRGTVLKELGRWSAALTAYGRAIAAQPEFHLAHAASAEALQALNQWPAALASYDRAIALNAGDPSTYNNRAVLLQRMGRLRTALADYDRAVAAKPDYAEAWFNRGTVLRELEEWDAAVASYDRAIAARPGYADAHLNRGVTLQEMGHLTEAIASIRRSLALAPQLPEGHYNLALASLTVGDFATGWAEYEWRWRAKGGSIYRESRHFAQPLWLGEDNLGGKTLLLYGEQGLGDALHFCRYVGMVAKLGPRIVLEVPRPLVEICARLPGAAQVLPYGAPLPPFDCQCPLMSLPLAFKTRLETTPAPAAYLVSDADKVAAWQRRLGARLRPRIGLVWSGNQVAGTNRKRHFPLASLLPFLGGDFDYFCLQTEVAAGDRDALAGAQGIAQFQGDLHTFDDTAALCDCMDLVISVDTSVAHLNAALGRKTWVLLAFVADWRWMLDREDSPWYPTMRLFRQPGPGDWAGVFSRVAAALRVEFGMTR